MSNLVLNGYFTNPTLTEGNFTYLSPGTLANWTAVNGILATATSGFVATTPLPSGVTQFYGIQQNVPGTFTGIYQDIIFPNFGTGVISFWISKRKNYTNTTQSITVGLGSNSVSYNKQDTAWYFQTISFTIGRSDSLTQRLSINATSTITADLTVYISGITIAYTEGLPINPRLLNNISSQFYDAMLMTDKTPSVDTTNKKIGSASLALNAPDSEYAQINNFSVPTTGLTIACWFKVSSVGNSRVFDFGNGQASDNIAYSPNVGTLYYIGTTAYATASASGKADNTWHHFAWTMTFASPISQTSTHTVYLDGSLNYTSATQYYPTVGPRTNCYLGRSNWSSDVYTTGNVDDFRIYNTVLSASDVLTLYYTTTTSKTGTINYSLVNYYSFETNSLSGTNLANLATGNWVYDSVLYNGATLVSTAGNYKVGSSALSLTAGSSQYAQINNFSVTNKGLTFACWFKWTTTTAWNKLFDFGNGTSDNIGYSPVSGIFYIIGATFYGPFATTSKADGNWHHFVWTMKYAVGATSTHTVYIDNVVAYTSSVQYYPTLGTRTNCYIGRSNFVADPYPTGYADDFRIYNNALTANDVALLYNSTNSISNSGNYTLGLANTTAITVYDASLNGGAYISTSNYIVGTGALSLDTSGQYVRLNNSLMTGNGLSFAFWSRSNNGVGINTLLDYSNGAGGNNKIAYGLLNNQPYAQVTNGTGIGTVSFTTPAIETGLNLSGTHGICMTGDGKRMIIASYNVGQLNTYSYSGSSWSLFNTMTVTVGVKGVCCTSDGNRIVFTSDTAGSGGVYFATWNSGTSSYIIQTPTIYSTTYPVSPSMTPDGRVILFSASYGGSVLPVYYSLWNGSSYTTPVAVVNSSGNHFGTDITSDGSRIAYVKYNTNEVFSGYWNGTTYVQNTPPIGTITSVAQVRFSPDGNILFVSASTNLYYSIYNGTTYGALIDSGKAFNINYATGLIVSYDNSIYTCVYTASGTNLNIQKAIYTASNSYLKTNFYTSQNLNDNAWRHYAWTIDLSNSTYKYYLNGTLIYTDASSNYAFPTPTTRTKNLLGVSTDLSMSYFTGGIDDYRVYASVLTGAQVADIYSGKILGNNTTELKSVFKPYSKGIQTNANVNLLGNDASEVFQPYTSGTKVNPTGVYAMRGGVLTDLCHLYQPNS